MVHAHCSTACGACALLDYVTAILMVHTLCSTLLQWYSRSHGACTLHDCLCSMHFAWLYYNDIHGAHALLHYVTPKLAAHAHCSTNIITNARNACTLLCYVTWYSCAWALLDFIKLKLMAHAQCRTILHWCSWRMHVAVLYYTNVCSAYALLDYATLIIMVYVIGCFVLLHYTSNLYFILSLTKSLLSFSLHGHDLSSNFFDIISIFLNIETLYRYFLILIYININWFFWSLLHFTVDGSTSIIFDCVTLMIIIFDPT